MWGAFSFTRQASGRRTSLISHCARLQQRWEKKFKSDLAFIVQISFVVQALGRTKRASRWRVFARHAPLLFPFFLLLSARCDIFPAKLTSAFHSGAGLPPWLPEIPFWLPGWRRSRRNDILKCMFCHISLALNAEGSNAVTRDLRQKRSGNTFQTKGEACVFDRAFMPDFGNIWTKDAVFLFRQPFQNGINGRRGIAELRGSGHCFFPVPV